MAVQPQFPRFEALLALVALETARLLGADRVDLRIWRLLPPSEQHVAGAAHIGRGIMEVGHDVPDFVEDVLRPGRPPLTRAEWERLCKVLGTLLHESVHLALPKNYRIGFGRLGRAAPSGVFLEEGVTESATQDLLGEVLSRVHSVFPEVSEGVPDRRRHYSNYVPATRELISLVSALPEMQDRDALFELGREGPERKMDLLVEQAMEGFGLTFNVPARDREEVRTRIAAALEAQVQRNHSWMVPPDPSKPAYLNTHEPEALSTIMGKQMGFELLRQLHAEGERVGMELPEGWRSALADQERRMARKLLGRSIFTHPEANRAVQSWIRALTETRAPDVPTVSTGEEWPRRASAHRRRPSWGRYARAERGMSR